MPSALWLNFVTKDQIGGQSEDQEENTQHHEVYIELSIFHIQQLQDFLWLLEFTHEAWTLQLWAIHPVDRQYYPLKAVPEGEISLVQRESTGTKGDLA